jgi:hypothetical protein
MEKSRRYPFSVTIVTRMSVRREESCSLQGDPSDPYSSVGFQKMDEEFWSLKPNLLSDATDLYRRTVKHLPFPGRKN